MGYGNERITMGTTLKTVGIIGGSGFIGSYITKKFLEEGYTVKASVTDIKRSDKYEHLFELPNPDHLNIKGLRLEDVESLMEFCQDCEILIHGGTPFQLDVNDAEKELYEPTLTGTSNFLEAVRQARGVEKVVCIASVAAFNTDFPMLPGTKQRGDTVDENDPPYSNPQSHPYAQAKFKANQLVARFIQTHPQLPFELASVSPVAVMGRPLSQRTDSTSAGLQFLIKNQLAPNPFMEMLFREDVPFAMVSVEDVAEAVYRLSLKTGVHGKNYLLSSESYAISDISLLLNGKQPKNKPQMVYSNTLATNDLNMRFQASHIPLHAYAAL
jgi:nucleoside-diphosphate-sugar epimerase